jgi:hypothetical protein
MGAAIAEVVIAVAEGLIAGWLLLEALVLRRRIRELRAGTGRIVAVVRTVTELVDAEPGPGARPEGRHAARVVQGRHAVSPPVDHGASAGQELNGARSRPDV